MGPGTPVPPRLMTWGASLSVATFGDLGGVGERGGVRYPRTSRKRLMTWGASPSAATFGDLGGGGREGWGQVPPYLQVAFDDLRCLPVRGDVW